MTQELHCYRCATCRIVAVAIAKGRWKCSGCRYWMPYLYSVPVETDEQRALYARGIAYNPHLPDNRKPYQPKQPWTCNGCQREIADKFPAYAKGGKFCRDCIGAAREREQMEITK